MKARYATTCGVCGKPVVPGDEIASLAGATRRWAHADCQPGLDLGLPADVDPVSPRSKDTAGQPTLDVTAPDAAALAGPAPVSAPAGSVPDAATPDAATPGAATPGAAGRDSAAPGTATPGAAGRDSAVRGTAVLEVWTDGACSGNPGPGGWAWATKDGRQGWGSDPATTNQRMEIHAALDACRRLPRPLVVVSDSTYVVNCFRDGWWRGWLARGWTTSAKKPVSNQDLWKPLVEVVTAGGVSFRWVKGHSGDAMNDLVDGLAVRAGKQQGSA